MTENVVSYETFRKFQRLETENDALQPLPEDFYESYRKWLERKQELYKNTKEPIIEREINNARKIIEEIIDRRQKKILLLADHSSRSNIVPKNTLKPELDCFNFVSNLLKEFKKSIMDTTIPSVQEETPEEPVEEPVSEEPVTEAKREYSVREGYTLVRVLDNFEKFIGTDKNIYGPLKIGDIVTLPDDVAKMLVSKEKAEILNPEL